MTAEDARATGYRLAPLPPSDREIGGIYLVPASHGVTEQCRRAARRVGFSVPCPGFVPSTGGRAPTIFARRGSFEFEWGFAGPPGYVGIPGGPSNHLFVMAAQGGMYPGGQNEFASCPGAVVFGRTSVRGLPAVVLVCATGSSLNSGHVLVRWREQGLVYEVSLHNPSKTNERIAEIIARSVVLAS